MSFNGADPKQIKKLYGKDEPCTACGDSGLQDISSGGYSFNPCHCEEGDYYRRKELKSKPNQLSFTDKEIKEIFSCDDDDDDDLDFSYIIFEDDECEGEELPDEDEDFDWEEEEELCEAVAFDYEEFNREEEDDRLVLDNFCKPNQVRNQYEDKEEGFF